MKEYKNEEYFKSLDKNNIEYMLWIASKDGDKTNEELGINENKMEESGIIYV